MRTAPTGEAPLSPPTRLLECARNTSEGRFQLRSKTLHDRDNCNRDAGGNESIFEGGRSRFVLEKGRHEILHCKLLLLSHGSPPISKVIPTRDDFDSLGIPKSA